MNTDLKAEIQSIYAQNDAFREKLNERNSHISVLEAEREDFRRQLEEERTQQHSEMSELKKIYEQATKEITSLSEAKHEFMA